MADQDGKKGISGAHTGADPGRDLEPDAELAAKIGDAAALGRSVLDDLAAGIDGGSDPEQSSLFEDDACLFAGPVAHVAEKFETAKGAGRPRGSKNKGNQQFRDYLLKQGYRHPGLNLADLANANPLQLAAELSCKRKEALELIVKANDILMPYFESKRPTDVVVTERQLGVLVIEGSGNGAAGQVEEGVYSVTGVVSENPDKSDT